MIVRYNPTKRTETMPSNKEMRERKNCELYAYLLTSLDKEVPDEILECIISYDYPLDCVADLFNELKGLDPETFEKVVNNTDSKESRELASWWEIHQEATRLGDEIAQTCL